MNIITDENGMKSFDKLLKEELRRTKLMTEEELDEILNKKRETRKAELLATFGGEITPEDYARICEAEWLQKGKDIAKLDEWRNRIGLDKLPFL